MSGEPAVVLCHMVRAALDKIVPEKALAPPDAGQSDPEGSE